jgi:hypothetical protein
MYYTANAFILAPNAWAEAKTLMLNCSHAGETRVSSHASYTPKCYMKGQGRSRVEVPVLPLVFQKRLCPPAALGGSKAPSKPCSINGKRNAGGRLLLAFGRNGGHALRPRGVRQGSGRGSERGGAGWRTERTAQPLSSAVLARGGVLTLPSKVLDEVPMTCRFSLVQLQVHSSS